MLIRLRPHHLLCTQGYSGKGYDNAFVRNMNDVVERLRKKEPVKIQLVFSTDDLCGSCPHMKGINVCDTNEKVRRFDRKVVEYFGLEEREYVYQDLVKRIDRKMTPEMLADICHGCEWYPVSACREKILGYSDIK